MNARPAFDVLAVGEAMIRLSVPTGEVLELASHLEVYVGGAEANVAVALARLGRSVAWMSRVADDPLGRRIVGDLQRHGVNCLPVAVEPGSRTGLYFTELGGAPRGVSVHYDRRNSAAAAMTVANTDLTWVDQARVLVVSGITPALGDGCADMTRALVAAAQERGCRTVIDVNFRSRLWSAAQARAVLEPLCAGTDVVLCTAEDARDVFGLADPDAAGLVDRLGARAVVLTEGAAGVSWSSPDDRGSLPAIPTETLDRIGAGDAFCAGVVTGVLDDDLEAGIRRGQAMASLARTVAGDQFLGTLAEVTAVLSADGRAVRR